MRTIVRWNHSYLKGIEKPLPTILEISHAAVLLIWVNIYPWLTAKLSPFGSWASSALFLCRKLRGLSSCPQSMTQNLTFRVFKFSRVIQSWSLKSFKLRTLSGSCGTHERPIPKTAGKCKTFSTPSTYVAVGVTGVRVLWALTLLICSPGLQPLCSCNLLQTSAGWPAESLG